MGFSSYSESSILIAEGLADESAEHYECQHAHPHNLQVCLATAITFMPSLRASAQDAPDLRSPALSRLYSRILAGEPNAEKDFFAGLVPPLVEPVEGHDKSRLVTFIWRGNADTRRVTVTGGRPAEDFGAPLARLPNTALHASLRTKEQAT